MQGKPIIMLLLVLFSFMQTYAQESRIGIVKSINTIESIFEDAYPDGKSGIHITTSGIVEEWDSTYLFRLVYNLRDIDLAKSEVEAQFERNELAILLVCRHGDNCVKVLEGSAKARFYHQFYGFTLPGNRQRDLNEVLLQLIEIQKKLPR